jgi:hypothetical protein
MAVFMRLWDAHGQGRLDDALDLIDPAASCAHRSPAAWIAATTARARRWPTSGGAGRATP